MSVLQERRGIERIEDDSGKHGGADESAEEAAARRKARMEAARSGEKVDLSVSTMVGFSREGGGGDKK